MYVCVFATYTLTLNPKPLHIAGMYVYTYVNAYVCACVRVRACVRACVRVCERLCVYVQWPQMVSSRMTCMYPPPHMTCMYPPPHMACGIKSYAPLWPLAFSL